MKQPLDVLDVNFFQTPAGKKAAQIIEKLKRAALADVRDPTNVHAPSELLQIALLATAAVILPTLSFSFELFVARTVKPGEKGSTAARRAEEIEMVIQAQRNFTVATALNIRIADFLRFNRIGPVVFFNAADDNLVEWPTEAMRDAITPSDAEFALRYATQFALAVERTVVGVGKDANLAPW